MANRNIHTCDDKQKRELRRQYHKRKDTYKYNDKEDKFHDEED